PLALHLAMLSSSILHHHSSSFIFFFNHPRPTQISSLSLHDALPISQGSRLTGRGFSSSTRCTTATDLRRARAAGRAFAPIASTGGSQSRGPSDTVEGTAQALTGHAVASARASGDNCLSSTAPPTRPTINASVA